jgi:hypothetical protein
MTATAATASFRAEEPPLQAHLHAICLDLDKRIARLALSLGLMLDEAPDMARLMQHVSAEGAPLRQERSWQELRGLVLLRHEMEKRCVDLLGAATAGEMLLEIECQMAQFGFPPGADGLDLRGLLGA